MDPCEHKYPVIDEHEGITVCCDCGIVLENELFMAYTQQDNTTNTTSHDSKHNKINNDALELLNRLNLPEDILKQLPQTEQNINNLYDVINKHAVVTTKEFCAASGIKNKKLVKMNQNRIIDTNILLLLEKYCKLLNLHYRDYTLIKANLEKRPESGHPPLTIIGYYIFQYCKTKRIKISMKQICSVLAISVISIQRYRKHELSCRC